MPILFAPQEIIKSLANHFSMQGFECTSYPKNLKEVRLPLYCKRGEEELVIDIITDKNISKEAYLPTWIIEEAMVVKACPVRFFQFYFPRARVFWAYGYYVSKHQKSFGEFKKACGESGIGLLEVSKGGVVTEILEPVPLNRLLKNRAIEEVERLSITEPWKNQLIKGFTNIQEGFLDEYVHQLIIYGDPQFQRREIVGRDTGDLSMALIGKLQTLRRIAYARQMSSFDLDFRRKSDNDHRIAFDTINSLWGTRLNIDYPDIHKDFEVLLLLDPYYRDHFLHQFQVFLLGALIIDKLYGETWVKDFQTLYGSKIEDAWLACSAYHDFNYPVQRWDGWMNRFLEQNFHVSKLSGKRHLHNKAVGREIMRFQLGELVIRDEFGSKMGRLCAAIGRSFDDDFQRFILRRTAVDKNHAVLGAFTFLEKFQKGSNLSMFAIDQAAASILLHDEPNWQCFRGDIAALRECNHGNPCSHEEKELSKAPFLTHLTLESKPLAFLLAFCDVAQEWGRKGRGYEIEKPNLEDVQIEKQSVLIHISVLNDPSFDLKEREVTRLGRYLMDGRFTIRVSSREGQRDATIRMSGT